METDLVPQWAIFFGSMAIVLVAVEIGYRLGRASRRRSEEEKEAPVSATTGSVLGLVAFMLAFTFGVVTDRYDSRKALLREEANAIGTAYRRSAFLPEADRGTAAALFKEYVDDRLLAAGSRRPEDVQRAMASADRIQEQLWDMAVAHARTDMNSDVAALYIESVNAVIELHALRVAVALQARVPGGIWLVLYALTALGMLSIGYQTGIAGSRRSLAVPILALAFCMVITLIVALDRPQSRFITVSHRPLEDLRSSM